jgi:hypothetical protein
MLVVGVCAPQALKRVLGKFLTGRRGLRGPVRTDPLSSAGVGTGVASTSARKIAHEMELSLFEWGEGEEEWFGRTWIPRIRPLYYREFKDENVVDIYAVLDWMSFSAVSPQDYTSSLYHFDDSSLIIPTFVLMTELKGKGHVAPLPNPF